MARVDLPQSKLRARRRRQKVFAALAVTALVAAVAGIILGVSWLPHIRVSAIDIEGVEGSRAEAIESVARKHIEGRYLYVFPKSNILIYPKHSLTKDLYDQFPRLAAVQVQARNFRTISIVVHERVPESLWCGRVPEERVPCVFMDEGGVAYEAAAEFSGTVYTEYFGSTTKTTLPNQYLAPEQFRSLTALVQAFKDKEKERIVRVVVDEQGDVRATFENGFTLMFVANEDSGDVYARFLLAKTAEPFTTHPLADFEYLDLRFGDRLYYKLKAE